MYWVVNPFAIIVVVILNILLGMLWYSPKVLGKVWADTLRIRYDKIKPSVFHYVAAIIVSLITATVMSIFISWLDLVTIGEGLVFGFLVWLGFVATSHFSGVIWAQKPFKAYLIDVSFLLVNLLIMGAILSVWW